MAHEPQADDGEDSPPSLPFNPRTLLTVLGAAVPVFLLGYLFLPITRWILYSIFVQSIASVFWAVLGLLAMWLYVRRRGQDEIRRGGPPLGLWVILVLTVLVALIVAPALSGLYGQKHIIEHQDIREVDDLPNTNPDHPRILPRAVADRYAASSMQFPVYKLSDSDITYHDGNYTWSKGLIPDRFMVVWFGSQHGAFFTNMETQRKDIDVVERDLRCGQGQVFTDSYGWRMNERRFDVDHRSATAFNFMHDDRLYLAQSYVAHDWKLGNPLDGEVPMPYVVPRYGGTLVIDGDCNIRDIDASEVEDSELLDNQSTYPYDLAIYRARAARMSSGIFNALFVGQGVPSVASTPGKGNDQPYTVPLEDGGLDLFVAMEPGGTGGGVYRIYTMDAQTGEMVYTEYNDTQLGPSRAADFVRKDNPRVNWATSDADGTSGTMAVSEPIPVVMDGELFWHVRAVPTDGTGVAFTSFVDARTGEVVDVDTDQQITAFLHDREVVEPADRGGGNQTDAGQGVVQIVIVEDGTVVQRINVTANTTVEIQVP